MGESKGITGIVAAGLWSSKAMAGVQSSFCGTPEPLYERYPLLLVVATVATGAHERFRRLCA
jgi:hypothetical protein